MAILASRFAAEFVVASGHANCREFWLVKMLWHPAPVGKGALAARKTPSSAMRSNAICEWPLAGSTVMLLTFWRTGVL